MVFNKFLKDIGYYSNNKIVLNFSKLSLKMLGEAHKKMLYCLCCDIFCLVAQNADHFSVMLPTTWKMFHVLPYNTDNYPAF